MPRRKVYHVIPDNDSGDWKIKLENSERASGVFDSKEEAVDTAWELARNQELGQINIHRKHGTLQTEYTYGKDPEKYKG